MARKTMGGPVPPGSTVYHSKPKSNAPKKFSELAVGGGGTSVLDMLGGLGASIAQTIERQANAQKAAAQKANPTPRPANPIEQLMGDFMSQYGSINVTPTPFEELQRMAEQQVGAQFDPMIQMLTQQMGAKQKRAGESQGQAREMYGALSKDFLSQLPQLTQQFAAEDQETNKRYDSAQQQLQQQYQGQQEQQNALLQQLGIQAAAPDASKRAMEDQSYFQGQMETDQQSALNALNQQQQAAQIYQQQLGDTTRVAGENTAQDIGRMLEDYLSQAEQQKTGLQAQRGSALQSLLSQMQGQAADRAAKEEQQQFDNLLNMSRFQLDAAQAAAKASGSPTDMLFKGTSGLSGAQNFLGQQYKDSPILASGIMEQLQDVLANPDVVRGKFELAPGDPALGKGPTYSDVGQEMMMDLLRKEFEQENQKTPGQYQTGDINNAINALLAYMGKLR
jgi:hypothetical protein